MTIKVYTPEMKDYDFWGKMGYFFASRKVRREMPYLIDDENYVWFVSFDGENIAGFAGAHIDNKNVGILHGIYVVDQSRHKGIAKALVKKRLEWLRKQSCKEFHAIVNSQSKTIIEKFGFVESRKRGTYTKMILVDSDE